ncbi:hypothetical protein [Alloprevotella sp. oral taxon 473]|uniref:hypothetical protein n=1 Tax=Alloprevotella sp. oral taxon 473 TaxID=712469 RepID=UPI0012ED492F|nr:hypothetical protein [Alloprevotella sp. oral taxon 473]
MKQTVSFIATFLFFSTLSVLAQVEKLIPRENTTYIYEEVLQPPFHYGLDRTFFLFWRDSTGVHV